MFPPLADNCETEYNSCFSYRYIHTPVEFPLPYSPSSAQLSVRCRRLSSARVDLIEEYRSVPFGSTFD